VSRRRRRALYVGYLIGLVVVIDGIAGAVFIPPSTQSFRIPHAYYHHGLAPGVETVTTWNGKSYAMVTDSLGFRDRTPRQVALRTGRPRTVLFGDSAIEGLGYPYDQTVAARMERHLQAGGDDREVLNGAAVSCSPLVYYLKARHLIEEVGLELDEMIVFIDISDIQDEVTYENFVPTLAAGLPLWPRTQSFLDLHSMLWRLTRLSGDRKPVSNEFHFKRDADINVWMENVQAYVERGGDVERGRWQWTIDPALQKAWANHGLALAQAHMGALADLAHAHGIALTVVVYPSPVQIYSNDRDSLQVRFWRTFAAEHAVGFIDLFPLFLASAAAQPADVYARYFIPKDSHWNVAGHEMVASAVVAARSAQRPKPAAR
jgi:hypothetical protein